jgi:hypothetical protein
MRKFLLIIGVCAFLLTGCSGGPPRSLRKTADEAMKIFFVEQANEYEFSTGAEMIDNYQLSETEWCLAYEGGETLHTATIWEKDSDEWRRVELRNFTEDCNWSH